MRCQNPFPRIHLAKYRKLTNSIVGRISGDSANFRTQRTHFATKYKLYKYTIFVDVKFILSIYNSQTIDTQLYNYTFFLSLTFDFRLMRYIGPTGLQYNLAIGNTRILTILVYIVEL